MSLTLSYDFQIMNNVVNIRTNMNFINNHTHPLPYNDDRSIYNKTKFVLLFYKGTHTPGEYQQCVFLTMSTHVGFLDFVCIFTCFVTVLLSHLLVFLLVHLDFLTTASSVFIGGPHLDFLTGASSVFTVKGGPHVDLMIGGVDVFLTMLVLSAGSLLGRSNGILSLL